MTIQFEANHLIGGMVLYLKEEGSSEDFMKLRVPRDALSLLAAECIKEIGMDASEELIELCRQVTEQANEPKAGIPPWRTLNGAAQEELHDFVCENIRMDIKELAIEELDEYTLEACAELALMGTIEEDRDPTKEEIEAWIKLHRELPAA